MQAWTLWLSGLPGSGKSAIAKRLRYKLEDRGIHAHILSTDELRKVMTPNPTYSEEEREIIYATAVYFAHILNMNGVDVIIDGTGNRKKYRDLARNTLKRFALVYVKCPLEITIERERNRRSNTAPQGIYEKALTGKSKTVPGVNVPFEEPTDAVLTVHTDQTGASECADEIIYNLWGRFF
jgi:adenylylsulfate kinase